MKTAEKQALNILNKIDKSSWELVSFGDVAREVRETVNNPVAEGIERVIGLENINPLDIHIRSWGNIENETTFTRKFKKGQVLFGKRRAYQRKAAIADFDGICSGDILVLEAIEEKMEPGLLPFLVHSDGFYNQAISTSAGSLSPRTKYKDLANFKFYLPPRPIQKKLAELLWAIDDASEKNSISIQKLNNFFNAKLQKIFNIQNKYLTLVKVKTLGRVLTGKTPPTGDKKLWNGSILFVTPTDLSNNGKYVTHTERSISNNACGNLLLPANSILVTCIASVGQIAINIEPLITNQQINSIIPREGDAEFLYYSMISRMHKLKRLAGVSVVPIVNKTEFESFEILYSSDANYKQNIVQQFQKIEHFKHQLEKQNDNLKRMLLSVLNYYL